MHDGVADAAFPIVISPVGPGENDIVIIAQLPMPTMRRALLDPQPTGRGDNELLRTAGLMSSHVLMCVAEEEGCPPL